MSPLMLAEVAERTGENVGRLRRWCATGQLDCGHDLGGWVVDEVDLARVFELGSERRRRVAAEGAIGLVVPKGAIEPAFAERVERALGLPAGSVAYTTLVIDDEEYAVAVWPSAIASGGRALDMLRLAEELGGDLLEARESDRAKGRRPLEVVP